MSTASARGRSPAQSGRLRSHSRHSASPRPRSLSRSASSGSSGGRRNGRHSKSRTRSPSHSRALSRSPSRGPRRYRGRSSTRSPSPPSPPRSSKIVVEKLTKNVTEDHLREIFGTFGDIRYLDLPMNRAFMTNRGTAYILYYDPADAEAAIAHMHEAQLDGAVLNVSIVLPRRAFSRSPPPAQHSRGNLGRHSRAHPSDSRASRPSPYTRRSGPSRRYGSGRTMERHDLYRPRSLSRSPRRSPSYSSRSESRSPPPRRRISPPRRRRRSPSYSSYDYSSQSDRSRSPNRSRYGSRR